MQRRRVQLMNHNGKDMRAKGELQVESSQLWRSCDIFSNLNTLKELAANLTMSLQLLMFSLLLVLVIC